MRPIHIATVIGSTAPVEEQFKLIRENGFDGIFTMYTGTEPIDSWAEAAQKNKLAFETIHAPFERANDLWTGGKAGQEALLLQKTILDACHRIHVDKCVMHVTVGNTAPGITPEGLQLFDDLCDYAKSKNVHICFENLEPLPHIDAVMEHITDSFHGFCWDCGHNACYTPHINMMRKFGSRLQCVHLHDNLGVTQPGNIDYRDDRHFLPFDGILDWQWVANQLKGVQYQGPVTLEVSILGKPEYQEMPLGDYLFLAHERGCRIRDLLD